ncbi:hypothetical protein VPH35_116756 [Triticum aestivum]
MRQGSTVAAPTFVRLEVGVPPFLRSFDGGSAGSFVWGVAPAGGLSLMVLPCLQRRASTAASVAMFGELVFPQLGKLSTVLFSSSGIGPRGKVLGSWLAVW